MSAHMYECVRVRQTDATSDTWLGKLDKTMSHTMWLLYRGNAPH